MAKAGFNTLHSEWLLWGEPVYPRGVGEQAAEGRLPLGDGPLFPAWGGG